MDDCVTKYCSCLLVVAQNLSLQILGGNLSKCGISTMLKEEENLQHKEDVGHIGSIIVKCSRSEVNKLGSCVRIHEWVSSG